MFRKNKANTKPKKEKKEKKYFFRKKDKSNMDLEDSVANLDKQVNGVKEKKLVTSDARTKRVFSEDEIAALSRIGNNLNQNTTFANSNKILSSKLENTLDMLEKFMNRFS